MPESKTPIGLGSMGAIVTAAAARAAAVEECRRYPLPGVSRGLTAALAAVAAGLSFASPAHAFIRSDQRLPMSDGVELATTLYVPDGAAPAGGWPAVLLLHGLGENRTVMNAIAEQFLVPSGYVALSVDARAHGESGGRSTLAGPREVADYAAALAWLRSRPGVSDTKVGALGSSLGGGSLWKLLAAPGTRLAAAIPIATWTSLFDALMPQGLAKAGLVAYFRSLLPDDRWDPEVLSLSTDALLGQNVAKIRSFAQSRSIRNDLERIRTPVFMIQGRRDYAFDMDQALSAFGRLRGPKRLYLGDLGHAPASSPAAERLYYLTQARLWLDRYLKGQRNGIDTRPKIELAPDPWTGRTTHYASQPPRRVLRLRFRGAKRIESNGKVVRTTAPTRRLNETFGSPLLSLKVASTTRWPRLVAVLSALTPRGEELVVSEGGAPTPVLSGRARVATIRLLSTATTIPRGSRLRLTVAGSSTAQSSANLLYPLAVTSGARVTIGEARMILPTLRRPISR
jgi:predicted acyl esterase